jgi:hypothetical protein
MVLRDREGECLECIVGLEWGQGVGDFAGLFRVIRT